MEIDDFLAGHCKFDDSSHTWHLIDQSDPDKCCTFLTPDNKCRIHEVKPKQCIGFPIKWRPDNILDFCEGWRTAAGLPPPEKRTMSDE